MTTSSSVDTSSAALMALASNFILHILSLGRLTLIKTPQKNNVAQYQH